MPIAKEFFIMSRPNKKEREYLAKAAHHRRLYVKKYRHKPVCLTDYDYMKWKKYDALLFKERRGRLGIGRNS